MKTSMLVPWTGTGEVKLHKPGKLLEEKIIHSGLNSIHFRMYRPEVYPKAVICFAHGMGEHSGRYQELANRFVSQGIAFAAFDYPGHGFSEGVKWHCSFKKLYSALDLLLEEVSTIYPGVPKILYGHDLGGSLVLNYFCNSKSKICGMIVSSPWLKHISKPAFKNISVIKSIKYFLPFISANIMIDPKFLTRNKKVVDDYMSDPLCRSKISLQLLYDAVVFGEKMTVRSYKLSRPTLIMHGTEDMITSCKNSELFARNTGKFLTLKLWEGCYHELHNEPSNQEIFRYIINWLNSNFKWATTGNN